MATVLTERCSVCSTPYLNTQQWPTVKTRSTSSSKRSSTKQNLNRTTIVQKESSVEDEYIKQLQKQIRVLEADCQYLRDELTKASTIANRSNQAELERSDLKRTLLQRSSQFEQLSSENHGLTVALDELRRKFDIEKQTLLNELATMRRARDAIEQELRQNREQKQISSDELKTSQAKVRIIEQQLEQQLRQNAILTQELEHMKSQTSNLQRNLTDLQTIGKEKDRLQNIVHEYEKEIKTLRQNLKVQDTRYSDIQVLRTKLVDEKSTLIKEVTRLESLTKEFERELEELRMTLRQLTDTLQTKDQELINSRKKEQSLRSLVDNIQVKFDTEVIKNQDLDGQLKQMQRQLNIEIQNALIAKREMNEYELRNSRLRDEIYHIQHEKDRLTDQNNSFQQRLTNEENLTANLRIEIRELESRVQEIDRLKTLEDLIQSQRWDDITQLAQTMQTVSRTMSKATSPTIQRKKRIELQ